MKKKKFINLVNGCVMFTDFVAVKSTWTPASDYVAAVTDSKDLLPGYLVFLDKAFTTYTEEEQDELYKLLKTQHPEIDEAVSQGAHMIFQPILEVMDNDITRDLYSMVVLRTNP